MGKLLTNVIKVASVLALSVSIGCETYPSRSVYVPGHGWADSENEDIDDIRYETQKRMDRENEFQRQRGEEYNRAMENRDRNMREIERRR